MKQDRRQSWFATLRRDRGLFAFVAIFALALAILQPAVPAAAATDGFVICSAHAPSGAAGKETPARHDECPCCTLGHLCSGLAPLAKLIVASAPAFAPMEGLTPLRPAGSGEAVLAEGAAALPPGIRAPPCA